MKTKTTLTDAEISSIENAVLTDPFILLGMHPLGPENADRIEIRTFCPVAENASIRIKNV